MKNIYNYNRITKEYSHTSKLTKDDFGNYNLPAFSTEIKPILKNNQKAIFNSKGWNYEEIINYDYIYTLDSKGLISQKGELLKTNKKCPDERFYKWYVDNWLLDNNLKHQERILEIKTELDELDTLMLRNEVWFKDVDQSTIDVTYEAKKLELTNKRKDLKSELANLNNLLNS